MSTNWSGTYRYRAGRRVHPQSVDELRQVVADASSVKVVGSGHSFNGSRTAKLAGNWIFPG